MTDSASAYRVETTPRLAQWRIDNLAPCTYRKSDPFRIGKWNWHLSMEKNRGLFIRLFPEISRDTPPIASFIIRVLLCSAAGHRKPWTHPDVNDKLLKNNDGFVWAIDQIPVAGKLIIDVNFLDLKTASSSNGGGQPRSIWHEPGFAQVTSHNNATALSAIGRMLSESIFTDITINVSDGSSVRAHRAILAARSPVFRSMFSDNLKLSSIDISDMTVEVCKAFLGYTYGNLSHDEFLIHRTQLLCAAHKYDIPDLKDACHDSLLEDIDTSNVLQRLQIAFQYKLPKLQTGCMKYLVKFGMIYEIIRDEFNVFLQCAERDLITQIFHEILETWNGF